MGELNLDALEAKLEAALAYVDCPNLDRIPQLPDTPWGVAVVATLDAVGEMIQAARERDKLREALEAIVEAGARTETEAKIGGDALAKLAKAP